jgi:hypothetical protein
LARRLPLRPTYLLHEFGFDFSEKGAKEADEI